MNKSTQDHIRQQLATKFAIEASDDKSFPVINKLDGESGKDYLVIEEDDLFACYENEEDKLELLVKKVSKKNLYHCNADLKEIYQIRNDQFCDDFSMAYLFDNTFNWLIVHDHPDDTILLIGCELVKIAKSLIGPQLNIVEPHLCRDLLYGIVKIS